MSGTVFDIGYRNYTGEREGRSRSQLAEFKESVRSALGLGRASRAKVLPWLLIANLAFNGSIMALVAGAAKKLTQQPPSWWLKARTLIAGGIGASEITRSSRCSASS